MMRYLSLFSGMEAAYLAWHPLGWECVGVAEIEPHACAVLRHRLPHVPNLGSVTDITADAIRKLGRMDVVIGGSPCQDLSVAGKRAGLAGQRSGLLHEQVRIFDAARTFCGARWLVWENVPGAFSSNAGRDFAVVVGTLAGCELNVPVDGWGSEGVALGDNGLVEWAVLDAQWFGVAQRRRRVFAVLDTGNWADRSPILLERDSLRGDSPPRREAGEGVAGTVTNGARSSGGYSHDNIPLTQAFGGNNTSGPIEVGTALNACASASGRMDFDSETFLVQAVAGTLNANGKAAGSATQQDAEAGMLVPVPFDTTQITSTANYSNPKAGDPCHPLAAGMHPPAVAFVHQGGGTQTTLGYDPASGTAPCLSVGQTPAIAFQTRGQSRVDVSEEKAYALLASGGDGGRRHEMNIASGMQVRRLTPRECERLQGAPDDWTLVPNAKGKPMADGPRYKMLGNSFAVPVIRWIGQQIERATAESGAG